MCNLCSKDTQDVFQQAAINFMCTLAKIGIMHKGRFFASEISIAMRKLEPKQYFFVWFVTNSVCFKWWHCTITWSHDPAILRTDLITNEANFLRFVGQHTGRDKIAKIILLQFMTDGGLYGKL